MWLWTQMALLGMNRPCVHKPPGWKCGSRGVNKHMCNSNPLLVWLWPGGIMYEFRGFMCTSFLYMRMNERQVFTRFQACRQAPGYIPMFYHIHEWFCGAQRENEIQSGVEINHKYMYMKGTWAGLCIFKNIPVIWKNIELHLWGKGVITVPWRMGSNVSPSLARQKGGSCVSR